jgi:hypothetical protein
MSDLSNAQRPVSFADHGTDPLAARRLLTRGLVVVGLVGVALTHVVQLPDTWAQMPALAVMFGVLAVAAVLAAGALVHADRTWAWFASILVAAAPVAGYVLTRSVSLPFDNGDVGNWAEPLALVAVTVELAVILLAWYAMALSPKR